ncbi:putative side tail fiber protein, partial [Escherichia coli EC1735]|jgi:hypothetical protein
MVR